MSYNLLGLPVQGYQKGGRLLGHGDDVEFDEDAYGGLPKARGVQGFQGGGRARALFNVGTSQLKHNIDIEDALEKLEKKKKKTQNWWESASGVTDALSNILSIGSMFIPGMQGLPLLTKALIGTGVKAGTKALSSAGADYLAPKVTTPKKIIDRQFGREGSPAIGTRDWEKIDEAYGDIGKFSNRAGLRMRQGALAGMPADFIQNLMQTYLMSKAFPSGGKSIADLTKDTALLETQTQAQYPITRLPSTSAFKLSKASQISPLDVVGAPEMGAYGTQPESTWSLMDWFSGLMGNNQRDLSAASGPYDADY